MNNVENLENHMAFACECGCVGFNLLKSGNIECESCGTVLKDCSWGKALEQSTEQEPVAWPCVIAEADFSNDTVTLTMQCKDYKVSAGTHWLSATPPKKATERNFCPRCGKRLGKNDWDIHTCTPPQGEKE